MPTTVFVPCIPYKGREPNEVDYHLAIIRKIQKDCQHDFRLLRGHKYDNYIHESKVPGVFLIARTTWGEVHEEVVECLLCNLRKEIFFGDTCPKCLGDLMKDGLEDRRKYWGWRFLGYKARLVHCPNCGFKGVYET